MSICERCGGRHKTNGHNSSVWSKKNKEKVKEYTTRWRANNPERIRELWKKAYEKFYETTKNTDRAKKYRQTKSGREAVLRAIRKYEAAHPKRRNAWIKAREIEKGVCIHCGKTAHRHHPDINKPLEVVMLCPFHHKEAHQNVL